jgi:hypothetical protein
MKRATKVIQIKTHVKKEETIEPPAKNDLQGRAAYMEKTGDLEEAARLYEKLLKEKPAHEDNYSRLMIIYRKQKDLKNELRVINSGIKFFQELYTPTSIGKHKNVIKLSKQLSLLTGLTDKKGKSLYDAEPIGKWKKRKEVVLKKLGKG